MTGIEVANKEPLEIVAGDTYKWTASYPDFPASDGWTLAYLIVGREGKLSVSTTPNGDDFDVTLSASGTLDLAPGTYKLAGRVSKAGETRTVYSADLAVTAALADQDAGFDPRTQDERILDAIKATIEGRASKDQQSYSIAGRSLSRMTIQELNRFRSEYQWRVNMAKGKSRRVLGRFT